MLSFRNKLNSRDPEAIRKISASTGFFDATDIEISVNLAHSALDGQRHANDNVEEPSFLLAEDNGKTVGYACFGKIQDCQFRLRTAPDFHFKQLPRARHRPQNDRPAA